MKKLFLVSVFFCGAAQAQMIQHGQNPLQAETEVWALAPWETPIDRFFVRSHHGVPTRPDAQWEVVIDGLVEKPLRLKLSDLKKFKQKTLHAVLECSGNGRGQQVPPVPGVQWQKGAVGNAEWTGVVLGDVLQRAGVKANAKFITVAGADEPTMPETPPFVRSIPLEKALHPETLLATQMNRVSMPRLHGGPVRLVLPNWYGQNWMKWVVHINVTEREDDRLYMKKAYRMPRTDVKPGEAWDTTSGTPVEEIRVQSFVTSPSQGQHVAKEELTIAGKAFSGAGNIVRVEVSVDDGKKFVDAQLEPAHATGGWREFSFVAKNLPAGPIVILSRATDEKGNVQPSERAWNPAGYLRNSVDRVSVVAGDETLRDGIQLFYAHCVRCHGAALVRGQNLNAKQWDAVVKKMEGFGSTKLEEPDRKALLIYLGSINSETRFQSVPVEQDELAHVSLPRGDTKRGKKLYATHCVACHGDKGQGAVGPRLKNRFVNDLAFASTVHGGKNLMPGLPQLSMQQVADIHSFLK